MLATSDFNSSDTVTVVSRPALFVAQQSRSTQAGEGGGADAIHNIGVLFGTAADRQAMSSHGSMAATSANATRGTVPAEQSCDRVEHSIAPANTSGETGGSRPRPVRPTTVDVSASELDGSLFSGDGGRRSFNHGGDYVFDYELRVLRIVDIREEEMLEPPWWWGGHGIGR